MYISGTGAVMTGSVGFTSDGIEATSTVDWSGGPMAAQRALVFGGQSVDPASIDGELMTVGFRASHDRPTSLNSHPFRVALVQDGRFYLHGVGELRDNVQDGLYTTWENLGGSPASDWHEVVGGVFGDPASNPDMTTSGAPIEIALMIRHGASSGTAQTFVSAFAVDSPFVEDFEVLFGVRPPIGFARVDDPGNPCVPGSIPCRGSVPTPFHIGRFEVTAGEYVEFLNAVAATDANNLYNEGMAAGGSLPDIERLGAVGTYSYSATGRADLPISYVSFWDAARYANWLHNGRPNGPQDDTTTEDGAYTLTPSAVAENSVTRNSDARFFIPTSDEWYKSGYYDADSESYLSRPSLSPAPWIESPSSLVANGVSRGAESAVVSPVGSHFDTNSPYGVFDQEGNVSEWTETSSVMARRIMGSWYYTEVSALEPNLRSPEYEDQRVGFRIASATPARVPTLGVVGAAVLSMAICFVALRRIDVATTIAGTLAQCRRIC